MATPAVSTAQGCSYPRPLVWKRFLASFFGGINEEILCRLFLLSFLAWLIAIVWHLPTTAVLTRLTPILVWRAMIFNGSVGIAYGYLFWRCGLEAAMLAHFSAYIVLHIMGDSIAKTFRETSKLKSAGKGDLKPLVKAVPKI